MPWIADLHIHSHFSMATSKEGNPVNLCRWAGLKGLSLIGTGDFTHPGWRQELREHLIPAEPGFYRLKDAPDREIPDQPDVRMVVSGELSTIYKKNGKTRKVHHVVLLPSLEDADRFSDKLESLGMNIRSDGRPILGMDSYHLLKIALDTCPDLIYIPAHIWTPHFSIFGSKSGFDSIEECYEDLTPTIYALETGLSADPAMIWQWSALDRFTLVSNSDAHNPQNLAREANLLDAQFSYTGLSNALQKKGNDRLLGTIEFFPEEGKYHYDGHRNCEVALEPHETEKYHGLCPNCGKKVTVGVLNRVLALSDRPSGYQLQGSPQFERLVPLRQVLGNAFGVGPASQKVNTVYFSLLHKFGPELSILRDVAVKDLADYGGPLLSTALQRLRNGVVDAKPGYDGEYGAISIIDANEREALQGQTALFELGSVMKQRPKKQVREEAATSWKHEPEPISELAPASFEVNMEQQRIIESETRVLKVIAGPGTGKTRTLVEKIAYLIEHGVAPAEITAVTFTNKAAATIKERLSSHPQMSTLRLKQLNIGTFHSIAWKILKNNPEGTARRLLDASETREIAAELIKDQSLHLNLRDTLLLISKLKNDPAGEPNEIADEIHTVYQKYQDSLRLYRRWDFDDLILEAIKVWQDNPQWLAPYKPWFNYLLVDEFQDVNPAQYQLVKLWAENCQSLMVIGDPNQSIYGFRGSSACFFDKLEEDFPETSSLKLSRNYRSTPVIIEAANHLIAAQYQQTVTTVSETSPNLIQWFEVNSEKIEARVITQEIIQLLGGSTMLSAHGQGIKRKKHFSGEDTSFSLSDMAILYRTGRQAEALEAALSANGLPYRVVGQAETLENTAVQDFLAFFRYLYQPDDLFLLRNALHQARWGLSAGQLQAVINLLINKPNEDIDDNLGYLLLKVSDADFHCKLLAFEGQVRHYQEFLTKPCSEIVDDWLVQLDLSEHLELHHVAKLSENYQNLADLLRFLPLATEADLSRYGMNSGSLETVTLSTIHASKGLEYPIVFLAGVAEGLLPFGADPDEMAVMEEQRLCYVGMTRAKCQLYLVNSKFRFHNGASASTQVSRFLKMIPSELVQKTEWQKEAPQVKQLELF